MWGILQTTTIIVNFIVKVNTVALGRFRKAERVVSLEQTLVNRDPFALSWSESCLTDPHLCMEDHRPEVRSGEENLDLDSWYLTLVNTVAPEGLREPENIAASHPPYTTLALPHAADLDLIPSVLIQDLLATEMGRLWRGWKDGRGTADLGAFSTLNVAKTCNLPT
ncbi:hypothetical protein AALO_G00120310 [Alosa alosa]|uniref:Uncharacterized protein n=1 Tax=Alosa alosa TaxID=278164 RepID=A0AAV6GJP3_9TELE|nr:hypothetical protein AALO_G00120310 [Alosa alosa]